MMKTSYIFIAGGIGITPFRSIISSLLAEKKEEDITLFYLVANPKDILCAELLTRAEKEIGITVHYLIKKRLTKELLYKYIPELKNRIYYLSGPQEMVEHYRDLLLHEGVSFENMKMDSFTGYDKV